MLFILGKMIHAGIQTQKECQKKLREPNRSCLSNVFGKYITWLKVFFIRSRNMKYLDPKNMKFLFCFDY